MIAVAQSEFLEPEFVRKEIADGRLVIPATRRIIKGHLQKNLQPMPFMNTTKFPVPILCFFALTLLSGCTLFVQSAKRLIALRNDLLHVQAERLYLSYLISSYHDFA